VNFWFIILDQLQPTLLPHIQIRLSKQIFQALMIRIDMQQITQDILPLDLQCMNNDQEFQIMSWIMLLMTSELS
jgi:hypothetical protein